MLKYQIFGSDGEKSSENSEVESDNEDQPIENNNLKFTIKRSYSSDGNSVSVKRARNSNNSSLDDDDESDEEVIKKPSRSANPFINDEVSEDDEMSSVYDGTSDEESLGSEKELASAATNATATRRHRNLYGQVFNKLSEDDLNAYFQAKYHSKRNNYYNDSEDECDRSKNGIISRPPDGAKLWIVKTKIGEAKNVAKILNSRLTVLNSTKDNRDIFSVISKDSEKSYVYVLSKNKFAVDSFIKGVRGVLNQKLKAVRDEDYFDTITEKPKCISVKIGAFVRFKRTKFCGDLAQIVQIDEEENMVLLKLVPRIDYKKLRGQNRLNMDELDLIAEKKRKYKRIPKALFNSVKIKKCGGDFVVNKGIYTFEKNEYANGFLFKWFSTKLIETEGVVPSSEEIALFDASISEGDDVYSSLASVANVNAKIEIGDKVELLGENYANVRGSIFGQLVKVGKTDIGKYFNAGDHIKVVNGKNANDTGTVVKYDSFSVYYISDLTHDENKVPANNCITSLEVSSGVDSCGMYSYLDIVKLDSDEVGIVIRIFNKKLEILNQFNNIITREPSKIYEKITSRNGRTFDINRNEVVAGNQVVVVRGNYAQKNSVDKKTIATVKFVCRGFLFLFDPSRNKNGGYFVVKQKDVVLYGKPELETQVPIDVEDVSTLNSGVIGDNIYFPTVKDVDPIFRNKSDGKVQNVNSTLTACRNTSNVSLIGKTIKISKGPYKGYVGMLKSVSGNIGQVELITTCRTINVDISRIRVADDTVSFT
ncbi:Transcription elongation factor SPT5 [Strongyloides ratti]|uniref:DRB sensitivity-inducing factor large subunit n=1 Tax=Strongyloides ratti TaxID=34506 RepID=A0A090LEI9_STRRB|nr:Transcription elongation factor SPT5 [Strongyloides ratti]CEF66563.1 Transcription elongation factor SPT5 [Strongyloides ratti]